MRLCGISECGTEVESSQHLPGESWVGAFVAGAGVIAPVTSGAPELLVVLETPNVSKMSVVILLLRLRRLAIEAVSSSFTVGRIRLGR